VSVPKDPVYEAAREVDAALMELWGNLPDGAWEDAPYSTLALAGHAMHHALAAADKGVGVAVKSDNCIPSHVACVCTRADGFLADPKCDVCGGTGTVVAP
jgi:hypothetical protein